MGGSEAQRERHQSFGVSGRLPLGKSKSLRTRRTYERGHHSAHQPRVDNKQKKDVHCTIPRDRVSWNSLEYISKQKIIATQKDSYSVDTFGSNARVKNHDPVRTTKNFGYPSVCQFRSTLRSAALQKSAVLSSSSSETDESCTSHTRRQRRRKLVDEKQAHHQRDLDSSSILSHRHRCVRRRLGSVYQRRSYSGSLDARGNLLSRECERAISNLQGFDLRHHHRELPQPNNPNSERQSNSSGILTQTRRNTVCKPLTADTINLQPNRDVQHQPYYQLSTGATQWCSRRTVQVQGVSRMASITPGMSTNIQQVGDTRSGSDGVRTSSCSTQVCGIRSEGSKCILPRCVQPCLESSTSVGIPTTMPDVQGPIITETRPRDVHNHLSEMEQCLLEDRIKETSGGTTVHHLESTISVDRHEDQPPSGSSRRPCIGGMEMSGWNDLVGDWSPSEISIIQSSWRPSTLKTYKQAWTRWLQWCKSSGVNNKNPGGDGLSKYLIYLYNVENLSYKTILVHKSVLSTFCQPDLETKLSSHILVRQTLKGIANKSASKIKPKPPVWNPQVVIQWFLQSECSYDSLFDVSRRCATLLLLASGRRVHDLTLLSVKVGDCIIEDNTITFWPLYGSKTDTINHRQSGWQLFSGNDIKIDLVFWIKKLLDVSQQRRSSGNINIHNLFVTTRGEPKPASRTIIAGWIKTVLVDAGIQDSPGSIRSAVASLNWASDMPLEDILARGNWSAPNTLIRFYKRPVKTSLLPSVPSLDNNFKPL